VLGGADGQGHFDWSKFQNTADDYRNGGTQLWGMTQIKKGLRHFGASLVPEAVSHRHRC
jgi:hypothetical protein